MKKPKNPARSTYGVSRGQKLEKLLIKYGVDEAKARKVSSEVDNALENNGFNPYEEGERNKK